MRQTKQEKAAFLAAGEPRREPDYMSAALRLYETLPPRQRAELTALLERFGALVQYERRWYFHRGFLAAKKETPD